LDIFVNNNDEKFKPISESDGEDFPKEELVQSMMKDSLENIPLEASKNSKFYT